MYQYQGSILGTYFGPTAIVGNPSKEKQPDVTAPRLQQSLTRIDPAIEWHRRFLVFLAQTSVPETRDDRKTGGEVIGGCRLAMSLYRSVRLKRDGYGSKFSHIKPKVLVRGFKIPKVPACRSIA